MQYGLKIGRLDTQAVEQHDRDAARIDGRRVNIAGQEYKTVPGKP
jgi:hypothetical protein